MPVGSRIYISYERLDSVGHAGRLYDALIKRFGADQVFMDVDSARRRLNSDCGTWIREAVHSCRLLIAMIGTQWPHVDNAHGQVGLDEEDDLVQQEITAAFERGIPVIPVLVQGATMPAAAELPSSLAGLTNRRASDLSDGRWHYDIARLMERMDDVLGLQPWKEAPSRRPTGPRTPTAWTRKMQLAASGYFSLFGLGLLVWLLSVVINSASIAASLKSSGIGLSPEDLDPAVRFLQVMGLAAAVLFTGLLWFLAFGSYRGWRWMFWVDFVFLAFSVPDVIKGPAPIYTLTDPTILTQYGRYALTLVTFVLFVWMLLGLVRFGPGAWSMRR